MSKLYRVSVSLNQEELIEFLDKNGETDAVITVLDLDAPIGAQSAPAGNVRVPPVRIKRTSKVNETILKALDGGSADSAALKRALEVAGLSPASLSTGVAALQKDGRISRMENGDYIAHAA